MGTMKSRKKAALIDLANPYDYLPAWIDDIPAEMLIEALVRERISLRTKQCHSGIRVLQDYLSVLENDQIGAERFESAKTLEARSELALEGATALMTYRELLMDELESREAELPF